MPYVIISHSLLFRDQQIVIQWILANPEHIILDPSRNGCFSMYLTPYWGLVYGGFHVIGDSIYEFKFRCLGVRNCLVEFASRHLQHVNHTALANMSFLQDFNSNHPAFQMLRQDTALTTMRYLPLLSPYYYNEHEKCSLIVRSTTADG